MNDFGGKLRQARERRGISLRQIATTTKISLGALEALERNDVSRLPGGIFTRSFVRSYAAEVGLDPDTTVHEFLERFQNVPTPPSIPAAVTVSEAESSFDAQQRLAGVVVKALLITVPLLVLILYFTMRVRTPAAVSSPSSSVPPAAARPEPAAPSTLPQSPTPVATTGASRAPMVDGFVLDVSTSDKCWAKITTDGKVTVARLMQAGDKERLEVHDKAVIQVGNAGAFTFAINGRPAKSLGPAGSIRTATLTKDSLARYLQ